MASNKKTAMKRDRDVEKNYPKAQFIQKLNRFAKALKEGSPFMIQVAKQTVWVPASAVISVEHERSGKNEELEFQIKWTPTAVKSAAKTVKKTSRATKASAGGKKKTSPRTATKK